VRFAPGKSNCERLEGTPLVELIDGITVYHGRIPHTRTGRQRIVATQSIVAPPRKRKQSFSFPCDFGGQQP
jgi:hypothetical protein